jgi:hypothetical protein
MPYFYLQSTKMHGDEISPFDRIACYFFLFVMFPTCTVFGLVSATNDLIDDWDTFGLPFSCNLTGY